MRGETETGQGKDGGERKEQTWFEVAAAVAGQVKAAGSEGMCLHP